ncbi:unnamed protein product [Candidula unifasciata]|uniref:Lipid droplet-associated hydrolase n=1 Tax=Candidula unifasciata TaxID=100452 RepID=A0A8S3ZBU0_9EUPU|nr:unnamed protein product [Candidula unifasciata]
MFTTRESTVREDFITVGRVKTAVLKLGHLRGNPENGNQVLMLIIPGNPGVPHFYEDFMQELYRHGRERIPVWTLGHAGHIKPPGGTMSLSDVYSTEENLFGLQAQISHKVTFVKEHIPPYVSLILIGHSIGCYMILNMLDQLTTSQVLHCFMLFPTIERMALSPSGQFMTPILRHLRWLVVMAASCFSILPTRYRLSLIQWWFRREDYPDCLKKAVLETFTPFTANFVTYLAKIEMNMVTELQKDLLQKHCSKLSLYYGACDHWAPKEYYDDLITEFPNMDARLCELGLKHAFVLQAPENKKMAKIVWQWAQSHCKNVLLDTGGEM